MTSHPGMLAHKASTELRALEHRLQQLADEASSLTLQGAAKRRRDQWLAHSRKPGSSGNSDPNTSLGGTMPLSGKEAIFVSKARLGHWSALSVPGLNRTTLSEVGLPAPPPNAQPASCLVDDDDDDVTHHHHHAPSPTKLQRRAERARRSAASHNQQAAATEEEQPVADSNHPAMGSDGSTAARQTHFQQPHHQSPQVGHDNIAGSPPPPLYGDGIGGPDIPVAFAPRSSAQNSHAQSAAVSPISSSHGPVKGGAPVGAKIKDPRAGGGTFAGYAATPSVNVPSVGQMSNLEHLHERLSPVQRRRRELSDAVFMVHSASPEEFLRQKQVELAELIEKESLLRKEHSGAYALFEKVARDRLASDESEQAHNAAVLRLRRATSHTQAELNDVERETIALHQAITDTTAKLHMYRIKRSKEELLLESAFIEATNELERLERSAQAAEREHQFEVESKRKKIALLRQEIDRFDSKKFALDAELLDLTQAANAKLFRVPSSLDPNALKLSSSTDPLGSFSSSSAAFLASQSGVGLGWMSNDVKAQLSIAEAGRVVEAATSEGGVVSDVVIVPVLSLNEDDASGGGRSQTHNSASAPPAPAQPPASADVDASNNNTKRSTPDAPLDVQSSVTLLTRVNPAPGSNASPKSSLRKGNAQPLVELARTPDVLLGGSAASPGTQGGSRAAKLRDMASPERLAENRQKLEKFLGLL